MWRIGNIAGNAGLRDVAERQHRPTRLRGPPETRQTT